MKKFLLIFLFIASFLAVPQLALAQDTRAQESRKAKLQREIEQIDKQLKANAKQSSGALSNLTLVRKKIDNRNALIKESDSEISLLSVQIDSLQKEIDKIHARLDTLTSYYSRLVLNAYKNRDSRVWYMYILASENLGQAFRRIGYLRSLSGQMNTQAARIKETEAELAERNTELQKMKQDAQELKNQRLAEVNSLQKEESESQSMINQLKRDRSKYQKELSAKQRQVDALNREIERIIREATKPSTGASKSKSGKSKTEIDYALDAQFANNKGRLPWPVDGPVVDPFGQRYHPVYKGVKLPFNNGITIAVSEGTPVKAVFDGVVKQIVVMPGYNKCVLVQHGNYFSFYCKLKDVSVKAGDKIKTGSVIGHVDTIGGESQLHFQIWKGSTPQNPESWLRP